MAYITQADITNVIDAINLVAMTDDYAQGQINQTVLNNILQLASDKADALVSSIYVVPFSAPVPVKVKTAAIIFAAEMLYQRRLTPDQRNPMTDQADHWRKELMDINRGLLSLDYDSKRAFTPIVSSTKYNRANTNIF